MYSGSGFKGLNPGKGFRAMQGKGGKEKCIGSLPSVNRNIKALVQGGRKKRQRARATFFSKRDEGRGVVHFGN